MLVNILDLLRGYHLSGTWQYWVVTRVRAVAVLIDHPALRAAIDAALPVVEHANKLRRQYTIAKGRHVGSDAAVLLDRRIDRLVAGAHGMIELLVRQGGERSHAAALLLEQAFPSGLAAHVNATFFAQVEHNAALLAVLRAPQHADVVTWLRLDAIAAELDPLCATFADTIDPQNAVTAAAVAEAELLGENAVMKVVCTIISSYEDADPAQRAIRNRLLGPLQVANDELREHYATQSRKRQALEPACEAPAEAGQAEAGGVASPPASSASSPPASSASSPTASTSSPAASTSSPPASSASPAAMSPAAPPPAAPSEVPPAPPTPSDAALADLPPGFDDDPPAPPEGELDELLRRVA